MKVFQSGGLKKVFLCCKICQPFCKKLIEIAVYLTFLEFNFKRFMSMYACRDCELFSINNQTFYENKSFFVQFQSAPLLANPGGDSCPDWRTSQHLSQLGLPNIQTRRGH